jgi:toxin ParE1/3/4
MRVTFDPGASEELDRIYAWIAKDNPRAALNMVARIRAKVMRLETPELTHMGRVGLVEGTRELLEWPYIIVYRVDQERNEIVVVSIVHGAQEPLPDLRGLPLGSNATSTPPLHRFAGGLVNDQ